MKCDNIGETIGNTPVVRARRLFPNNNVWIKVERTNPGGSIKDRIALGMIEDAERRGIIRKGSIIVEPTSGNTGIGLAMIAAVKGYKIILVMSEAMSIERQKVMRAFGAKIVLTAKEKGTYGAVEKAKRMVLHNSKMWMPSQFENRVNISTHINTTAQEILRDFPDGIDYLITASGTGGHISALAIALKNRFAGLKVYAVEPDSSCVISGGKAKLHIIAGISPGFIPKNLLLSKINGVIQVNEKDVFKFTKLLPKTEGILGGLSTGAALAAVHKFISVRRPIPSARILTFNYDLGERYLSVDTIF